MKRIITFITLFVTAVILIGCVETDEHWAVYNAIDIEYAQGDRKGSVTQNFNLPTSSNINVSASLSWTSLDTEVIAISIHHEAVITRPITDKKVSLQVTVTIEGKSVDYTYDVTVKAKQIENFTIKFYTDEVTIYEEKIVIDGEKVSAPNVPTKSGYAFVQWQLDGVAFDFDTVITKNISLLALWNELPAPGEYTITFDTAGGSEINPQTVAEGNLLTRPDDPTKENHDFIGWQLEGVDYGFDTPVMRSFTLLAIWEPRQVPPELMVTITFNTDGGTLVDSIQITKDTKLEKFPDTLKEGFTLIEWQLEGTKFELETLVDRDIELVAIWQANQAPQANYKVEYLGQNILDDDYHTLLEETHLTDEVGQNVTAETKTFEGFTLVSGQNLTSEVLADGTMIITVKYNRQIFDIQFTHDESIQKIRYGGLVVEPNAPEKVGYTFINYQKEGIDYDFNDPVLNGFTLDAIFDANDVSVTINHKQQNIENDLYTIIESREMLAEADTNIRITDHIYEGFIRVTDISGEYQVLADGTLIIDVLYDRLVYQVSFDGQEISDGVRHGASITAPNLPVEAGYAFNWTPEVPQTITSDMSFTINRVAMDVNYTINYYQQNILDDDYTLVYTNLYQAKTDSAVMAEDQAYIGFTLKEAITPHTVAGDGSTIIDVHYDRNIYTINFTYEETTQTIRHGGLVVEPDEPEKPGYTFAYYKKNENRYQFDQIVTESFDLEAHFTEGSINYQVSHLQQDITGSTYSVVNTYTLTTTPDTLVDIDAVDYEGFILVSNLSGYSINVDGSTMIEIKYDRRVYQVSFDGAEIIGGVRHGASITAPALPVEAGYAFNWTPEIPQTITSDMVFIAERVALDVIYTVNHYQQNLLNDDYILKSTDTYQAKSGSQVTAEAQRYSGFTLREPIEEKTVLGNGTLVIDVYYNRNIYEVSFTEGTNSQFVRYEQVIEAPTKFGFSLKAINYHETGLPFSLNSPIIDHTVLSVDWKPEVTFDKQTLSIQRGASNLDYIALIGAKAVDTQAVVLTVDDAQVSYMEAGTYTVFIHASASMMYTATYEISVVIEDSVIVVYHITNEDIRTIHYPRGLGITDAPSFTNIPNHTFEGWTLSNEPYTLSTPLEEDLLLFALWIPITGIAKIDVNESQVDFFQSNNQIVLYLNKDNQIIVINGQTETNVSNRLNVTATFIELKAVFDRNDQNVIDIVAVSDANIAYYIRLNTQNSTYLVLRAYNISGIGNVIVHNKFNLYTGKSQFIIAKGQNVYLLTDNHEGEKVLTNVSTDFNLESDEYILETAVNEDQENIIIRSNKRYFIPRFDSIAYDISGTGITYVDMTSYLESNLGGKIMTVHVKIDGMLVAVNEDMRIHTIDAHGNKRTVNYSLESGEKIVSGNHPYFMTNQNRIIYVDVTDLNQIIETVDIAFASISEIEIMIVGEDVTLIKRSDDTYYLLNNDSKDYLTVTTIIHSETQNQNIAYIYNNQVMYIITDLGDVVRIA